QHGGRGPDGGAAERVRIGAERVRGHGRDAGRAEHPREDRGGREGERAREDPHDRAAPGTAPGTAPTRTGGAVDGGCDGWEQQRADEQSHGPLGQGHSLNHDARRGGGGDFWAGVDRADGAEDRAPELREPFLADGVAPSRGAFAASLYEHRGDARGVERRLLADGEVKGEVRELYERARRAGVDAAF